MRSHDHPGCRYNGELNRKAWLGHLRSALIGWVIVSAVLYACLVVVALCVKAIR